MCISKLGHQLPLPFADIVQYPGLELVSFRGGLGGFGMFHCSMWSGHYKQNRFNGLDKESAATQEGIRRGWSGDVDLPNGCQPKNRGKTPKSSILIGFSLINHPFWGFPTIFGNTQISGKFFTACNEIHPQTLPFWNQSWDHTLVKGVKLKSKMLEYLETECGNKPYIAFLSIQ